MTLFMASTCRRYAG